MQFFIRSISLLLLFFCFGMISTAQVTGVRLLVHVPLPDTLQRPVYVTGSFNRWYAGDSLYKMEKKGEGIYTLLLPVYTGKLYEYKYTRATGTGWNWLSMTVM